MRYYYIRNLYLFFSVFLSTRASNTKQPPHIIVILADDLGWNDVSFHGSNQIPTPNIDALAYNGIILNNHHVQPLCTPTRSAFLTGKYPIHTGMQHDVIEQPEPRGLPLNETLMPQYLKKLGYSTHIVGKWHLGFFRSEYTPTLRGFDSHFGYWNSFQDYFDHYVYSVESEMSGYDMRRNMEVDRSADGKYSTELFSNEAVDIISAHNVSVPMYLHLAHLAVHVANSYDLLQAPREEIDKFSHIADPNRRRYAAMLSLLDKSVGDLMTALESRGMMDNSIILLMTDNGAEEIGNYANHGSNYPLKGQKDTPWEGGSRGVAAIWSSLFSKVNYVSNELIHISDWLPTFWSAAGGDVAELGNIDGINMWSTLKDNLPSSRTEYVLNIDPLAPYVAIQRGQWKYINGTTWTGKYDIHFKRPNNDSIISYNISNVLSSPTAADFEAYYNHQNNADTSADVSIRLTEEDILALRERSRLNCNNKENTLGFVCDPLKAPCLFNLDEDPCEYVNLATVNITVLESMQDLVNKYEETSIPPSNKPSDLMAHPKYYDNVWVSWKDDDVMISI